MDGIKEKTKIRRWTPEEKKRYYKADLSTWNVCFHNSPQIWYIPKPTFFMEEAHGRWGYQGFM